MMGADGRTGMTIWGDMKYGRGGTFSSGHWIPLPLHPGFVTHRGAGVA
jgi:hypothetical protein